MKQNTFKRLIQHWLNPYFRVAKYFPNSALQRLSERIAQSEHQHLGQIRFVVESRYSTAKVLRGLGTRERAWRWFGDLRVWDTERNSGVLIYICFADRAVEIVADRGISQCVSDETWQCICQQMSQAFRQRHYIDGLTQGLQSVDEILRVNLPRENGENVVDELPNDVIIQ